MKEAEGLDKTLYNQRRPKNFDEFIGQDTRSLERILQERRNRSFLITGPPGTGKTTLAGLIARSYLCDNPGEGVLLCGRCPTCAGDWHELAMTHPLINCHTVEDAATTKDIISLWLERSHTQPIDPSQRRRKKHIFILDELQQLKAAPQTLSQLLAPLEEEGYRERSTWILLSMDYASLPERPRVAIASRCHNITLRPLPPPDIEKALLSHPSVSPELAKALSVEAYSRGNLRQAWYLLERFLPGDGEGDVNVDDVHTLLGGGATPSERAVFFQELSSSVRATQKAAIERLKSWRIEEDTLVFLIEDDLLLSKGGRYEREFCQALGWWHASAPRPALWTIFLAMRGKEIILMGEPPPPPPPSTETLNEGGEGREMGLLLKKSIREFL